MPITVLPRKAPGFFEGLGEGIAEYGRVSLNQKIQEQQEQKKIALQQEYNKNSGKAIIATLPENSPLRRLTDEQLSSLPPETILELHKDIRKQGLAVRDAQSKDAYRLGDLNDAINSPEPNQQNLGNMLGNGGPGANLGPSQFGQPSQTPFMLPGQTAPNRQAAFTPNAAASIQQKSTELTPKQEFDNTIKFLRKIFAQRTEGASPEEIEVEQRNLNQAEAAAFTKFKVAAEQEKLDVKKSSEERQVEASKVERFKPIVANNLKSAEEAEKIMPNFEAAILQNEKMKTSPASWDAMAESLGEQYPWIRNFTSKNAQFLQAQTPAFIADFKGKMGGVLTDAKIGLIAKKVAGVGKYKDANRMILYTAYFDKKLDTIRAEETNSIIRENDGLIPKDFDIQLKKRMAPYRKEINEDVNRLLSNKMPKSALSVTDIEKAGSGTYSSVADAQKDAYKYDGKTATDTNTGQRYKSINGKWIPIK